MSNLNLVIAAIVVLVFSCSQQKSVALSGNWQMEQDKSISVRFSKDSVYTYEADELIYSEKYLVVNQKNKEPLLLTISGTDTNYQTIMGVTDSILTLLTSFQGKVQTYHKKKQELSVKSFQGTWFEIGEENASFRVEGTEVIYTENQDMPAKMQIKNDSIILDFGNQVMVEKIERLDNDTLTLTNDGISTTYVRRE